MTGEVIKSFLVGLGFSVDDSSLAKFNKSISSASVRVTALYTSIKTAATGIVFGISKISEGFEAMGYEMRLIAPSINRVLMLRRELLKAYSLAGVNILKVVQDSVKLNISLTKTRYAFEAIYRSVASRFFGLLTKQSDLFRQKLYANMPKIQNALERFVKFIFKAFEATTILGATLFSILTRVFDFFVMLHKATDGWSTAVLAIAAAWQVLNLSFLATPLGMIIAGFIAILALYDDFKTFQEGGKSFFDWGPVVPIIDSVTEALTSLWEVFKNVGGAVLFLGKALTDLFSGNAQNALTSLSASGDRILSVFSKVWDVIKSITAALDVFGNIEGRFIQNTLANLSNGSSIPHVAPLGANGGNNSQVNQHVQQQTSITVQGSANAQAVGSAVASEQSKVNFDMTRNMRGAVKAK